MHCNDYCLYLYSTALPCRVSAITLYSLFLVGPLSLSHQNLHCAPIICASEVFLTFSLNFCSKQPQPNKSPALRVAFRPSQPAFRALSCSLIFVFFCSRACDLVIVCDSKIRSSCRAGAAIETVPAAAVLLGAVAIHHRLLLVLIAGDRPTGLLTPSTSLPATAARLEGIPTARNRLEATSPSESTSLRASFLRINSPLAPHLRAVLELIEIVAITVTDAADAVEEEDPGSLPLICPNARSYLEDWTARPKNSFSRRTARPNFATSIRCLMMTRRLWKSRPHRHNPITKVHRRSAPRRPLPLTTRSLTPLPSGPILTPTLHSLAQTTPLTRRRTLLH